MCVWSYWRSGDRTHTILEPSLGHEHPWTFKCRASLDKLLTALSETARSAVAALATTASGRVISVS